MKRIFRNKKIFAIYGILPSTSKVFDDEMQDGYSLRSQRIKKNMGYGKRYRSHHETTVSMLCIKGLNYMLDNGVISTDDIGAVVVSTFTPDYYVPQVSNLIQAECGLSNEVFTIDLWDGCAGYLAGLVQACMLADQMKDKKVLLFTGDVVNRLPAGEQSEVFVSPPYGGDGASITVLGYSASDFDMPVIIRADGTKNELISIRQGAFADLFHQNNDRNSSLLDPGASFRFFQDVLPACIQDTLTLSDISLEDIDGFSVIQANALSARKIADKLDIPYEKVPMDLVSEYGDLSSTLNAFGIIHIMKEGDPGSKRIMIVSYGSGLKYGATIIQVDDGIPYGIIHTDL